MKLSNGYQTTTTLFIVLISILFLMINSTEAAPMPLGFQKVDCIVAAGARTPYCGGGL